MNIPLKGKNIKRIVCESTYKETKRVQGRFQEYSGG